MNIRYSDLRFSGKARGDNLVSREASGHNEDVCARPANMQNAGRRASMVILPYT